MLKQNSNGRWVSIWSVKYKWRIGYSGLFLLQLLIGMAYFCWQELAVVAGDTPEQTAKAIMGRIPVVGAIAAINTVAILEGLDIMMGARDAIREWLDERRTRKSDEAKAAFSDKVQDWYARQQQAIARGEDFNEPPPKA